MTGPINRFILSDKNKRKLLYKWFTLSISQTIGFEARQKGYRITRRVLVVTGLEAYSDSLKKVNN